MRCPPLLPLYWLMIGLHRTRIHAAWSACLMVAFLSFIPMEGVRATVEPGYPRIMGMNIGDPVRYDDPAYQRELARVDVLVLNFWPKWKEWRNGPWSARKVVQAIKAMHPEIVVGQYTNLNEAKPSNATDRANIDIAQKLDQENWWLLNASGQRQQWTDRYLAFDVNITDWVRPDRNGLRYPEWYAERNRRLFFSAIPELDVWYLDNSLSKPAVRSADWNGDKRDELATDAAIAEAYRKGHVRYWRQIRTKNPSALLIGNADDISSPEYAEQLNGVYLEALIGESWSTETRSGWQAMMARYRAAMGGVVEPKLVGFGVVGSASDYRRMRYGLASCLLDNGYFSYSVDDGPYPYGGVAWFDEFDAGLGQPIEPPVTKPWRGSVYRRDFDGGLVLVNTSMFPVRVSVEPGFRRISGKQDPAVNDGSPVSEVSLSGRDGIILLKVGQ